MEGGGEYSRYLLGDPLSPQFPPQPQDGGSSAADAGIWMDSDTDTWEFIDGHDHSALAELFHDDSFGTNNQQLAYESSSGVNLAQVDADPVGRGYVLQPLLAAAASVEQNPVVGPDQPAPAWVEQSLVVEPDQPAPAWFEQSLVVGAAQAPPASNLEQSPVGADQMLALPAVPANATIHQVGIHDMLTTNEDVKELAEMIRVAAQCGEDDAPTVWSEEEQNELLNCLHLYAGDDAVTRCFKIAFHLPRKTAVDVALRCRWLQDKSKTARKTQLAQNNTGRGKLDKVKKTKVVRISNKTYPLSEEALNSKSTKELIRDNIPFLKRIEENLRTGQPANNADYFHYIKTNMEVLEKRCSEFGISMVMPPIDEQGLEEILRARQN